MSVPFTTLNHGDNAQSLAMANEIVLAYNERSQVLGGAAVDPLVAGDNAQDKTLFLEIQTWLEANCVRFIDYISGPLIPDGSAFLYFTLATWQAAAGLNVSAVAGESFRRRINPTDADSYGYIQTGDCRGIWCFQDLQKGFAVLRQTVMNAVAVDADVVSYVGQGHGSDDPNNWGDPYNWPPYLSGAKGEAESSYAAGVPGDPFGSSLNFYDPSWIAYNFSVQEGAEITGS